MIPLDALGRWVGSAPYSENRVTLAWPAIFFAVFLIAAGAYATGARGFWSTYICALAIDP